MIVSSNREARDRDFEKLLEKSQKLLERKNRRQPAYFSSRTPTEFERDVHEAMCEAARGTSFRDTLKLVSGHRFPDIIINNYYGVEVKTAKKSWKSTGNSVLESTRVDGIERIYLFFCRQARPANFKFRKYEECLCEVAVTHSPRYLINMELTQGHSIFDKMRIPYSDLRKRPKPIKPFVDYYRKRAKYGEEEPWWMEGADDDEDAVVKPTVSLWSALSLEEQDTLRNQAMALFPEVFGNSSTKYRNLSLWLATRKGVVDSSLRDRFTAGGRATIEIGGKTYKDVPKIFFHLRNNLEDVVKRVKKLNPEEAKHFWGVKGELGSYTLLPTWLDLVIDHAEKSLRRRKKFIVHLLGGHVGFEHSPSFLREEMAGYGLNYSENEED